MSYCITLHDDKHPYDCRGMLRCRHCRAGTLLGIVARLGRLLPFLNP